MTIGINRSSISAALIAWLASVGCSSTDTSSRASVDGAGGGSGNGGNASTGGAPPGSGGAGGIGNSTGGTGTGGVNSGGAGGRGTGGRSTGGNPGAGGLAGSGAGGAGGTAGAGGASTGGSAGTGGVGPATCPDHVPRSGPPSFNPERCTFADVSLHCVYSTPDIGAGCTTTFICRCLSNHMGGADCNWLGEQFLCPDGGP